MKEKYTAEELVKFKALKSLYDEYRRDAPFWTSRQRAGFRRRLSNTIRRFDWDRDNPKDQTIFMFADVLGHWLGGYFDFNGTFTKDIF